MEHLSVIIAAGGLGERLGGKVKKQFLEIRGKSLLVRAVGCFLKLPEVKRIVVALPHDELSARKKDFTDPRVSFVAGGTSRAESVGNALSALAGLPDSAVVLVHDAARPLVGTELIRRVTAAVLLHGAAIPVLPVTDTVKELTDGFVSRTADRTLLARAQTPQGARCGLLRSAYAKYRGDPARVTDEAMLLETAGIPVAAVEGDPVNLKVTAPEDIKIVEALLS